METQEDLPILGMREIARCCKTTISSKTDGKDKKNSKLMKGDSRS